MRKVKILKGTSMVIHRDLPKLIRQRCTILRAIQKEIEVCRRPETSME